MAKFEVQTITSIPPVTRTFKGEEKYPFSALGVDENNWHMTLPEPGLTILMIEAKAKLIEANKKLEKVLQSLPEIV